MTEAGLRAVLVAEGVPSPTVERAGSMTWSNGPGDRYAAHRHDYDKVLLVLAGSIAFELAEAGRSATIGEGGRLDLPSGTLHAALVGSAGVRCLELHLPAGSLAARALLERGAGVPGRATAETGDGAGS
jgi:quercetin dioxygenase-like cupin family protein